MNTQDRATRPHRGCAARRLLVLLGALAPLAAPQSSPATPIDAAPAFVANQGQWPDDVRFVAHADGLQIVVREQGWDLLVPAEGAADATSTSRRGTLVRHTWTGLDLEGPVGLAPSAGLRHYLRGDVADWVGGVPAYASVRFSASSGAGGVELQVSDGGLVLTSDVETATLVGEAGLRVEGADALTFSPDGGVLVEIPEGTLALTAPTFGESDASGLLGPGGTGALRQLAADVVGFDLPDGTIAAEVEIGLVWATFLGGQSFDYGMTVEVDEQDRTVLAGFTEPSLFPATPGAFDVTLNGARDAFVSCLSADGATLVWSTYLGGSGIEEARALALCPDGRVTVTGYTGSANFPTTGGAVDTAFAGGDPLLGSDAFVAQLSADGSTLLFSTFLGGTGDELGLALGVRDGGEVLVGGTTRSAGYPTTSGAWDDDFNGGTNEVGDGFVTCLSPDGSALQWSTFIGGAGPDLVNALVVHGWGAVTVAGWTGSAGFPTTSGAYDRVMDGTSDAFVLRLGPAGDTLGWSTLLGGASDENATALAPHGATGVVVTGTTRSNDFPASAQAFSSSYAGGVFYGDVFVTAVAPDGATLLASSLLGGVSDDFPVGIDRNPDGSLLVGGWTQSPDFPVTLDGDDVQLDGANDGFVARLDAFVEGMLYGAYLGGDKTDKILDVDVGPTGRVAVVGWTSSQTFPATDGAYDSSFSGLEGLINDAFAAEILPGLPVEPVASTWQDLGFPVTGGSPGVPVLSGDGSLQPGSLGTLTLTSPSPNAAGLLLIGSGGVSVAYKKNPVIMPWPLIQVVGVVTDAQGGLQVPFVVDPTVMSGTLSVMQVWVVDPTSSIELKASNSLLAAVP